jgi:hypothetical protein
MKEIWPQKGAEGAKRKAGDFLRFFAPFCG